jgi:hypothetical protein
MNKVKIFISNNKEELKVLAYGTAMLTIGILVGKKYEDIIIGGKLEIMAKNKIKLKTVIDNEMYVMSIVKEQIKND